MNTSKLSSADLAEIDALLTKREVADLYGATVRFVETLIADGKLPAFKVGARLVRIRRSDALAVLRPIRTVGDAV